MTRDTPKGKVQRKRVTFTLERPGAAGVILMGDFNHWDPRKHIMSHAGGGIWRKTVMLAPGTYEYRFLVDGQWCNDPNNPRTVPNRFGTLNNVLTV